MSQLTLVNRPIKLMWLKVEQSEDTHSNVYSDVYVSISLPLNDESFEELGYVGSTVRSQIATYRELLEKHEALKAETDGRIGEWWQAQLDAHREQVKAAKSAGDEPPKKPKRPTFATDEPPKELRSRHAVPKLKDKFLHAILVGEDFNTRETVRLASFDGDIKKPLIVVTGHEAQLVMLLKMNIDAETREALSNHVGRSHLMIIDREQRLDDEIDNLISALTPLLGGYRARECSAALMRLALSQRDGAFDEIVRIAKTTPKGDVHAVTLPDGTKIEIEGLFDEADSKDVQLPLGDVPCPVEPVADGPAAISSCQSISDALAASKAPLSIVELAELLEYRESEVRMAIMAMSAMGRIVSAASDDGDSRRFQLHPDALEEIAEQSKPAKASKPAPKTTKRKGRRSVAKRQDDELVPA